MSLPLNMGQQDGAGRNPLDDVHGDAVVFAVTAPTGLTCGSGTRVLFTDGYRSMIARYAISAAMRGNLVAQTAGSRRAELDVLRPVTPAAQRPCQRFGSADERAHSPRRAWLSLHRAISGCGDLVSHEDRASRPVQEALPASPAQVDAQTRVVRPPPRQVLL